MQAHRTVRRLAAQRGVSLIEVCTVLAIAGVLAGSALPAWEESSRKRHFEGAVAEIATEVAYARSEAVTRGQGVWMGFHQVAGGSCTLIHVGAKEDCTCADGGQPVCAPGATALKATLHGVTVQGPAQPIRFNPVNGTVTPTATIHVIHAPGREVQHKVSLLGRVRSCSPQAAVQGYSAC